MQSKQKYIAGNDDGNDGAPNNKYKEVIFVFGGRIYQKIVEGILKRKKRQIL
jgi:hypothetical protein